MATFTSKAVTIDKPAADIVEKFSDLSRLQEIMDQLPEDQRAKIGDVSLNKDNIIINTTQVGQIKFEIVERAEDHITFNAVGAPVPLKLVIKLKPLTAESTELTTNMEVDIPPFLKAMVGGAMQKAVDQFSGLMQKLA